MVFQQKGTVLIVAALLLLALFAAIALGVDITLGSASKAQYQHAAANAVLSALEVFQNSRKTKNVEDSLIDATTRAKEITQLDVASLLGKSYFQDPDDYQNDIAGGFNGVSPGNNGTLIPGQWYFDDPDPPNPSGPCKDASALFHPCFVAATSATDPINGMQIHLWLSSTSRLKTTFAKVFNQSPFMFEAQATAASVPRHAVFLVDLTITIARDTHLPNLTSEGYYGFFSDTGAVCPISDSDLIDGPDELIVAGDPETGDPATLPADRAVDFVLPGYTFNPVHHYRSDYECYMVPKVDDPSHTQTRAYLLDTYADPEPLSSVLMGIHTAMDVFRKRSVAGDLVGIIGFDSKIEVDAGGNIVDAMGKAIDVRLMPLTDPQPQTPPSDYDTFLELTNRNPPQNLNNATWDAVRQIEIQKKADKAFFPNRATTAAGKTNIGQALDYARTKMLTSAALSEYSENFVVIFTDGRSNCVNTSNPPDCTSGSGNTRTQLALDEIETVIKPDYVKDRIALHVFLVGDKVAPHTLLKKQGDHCMLDVEARSVNPPIAMVDTNAGCVPAGTCGSPFFLPNQLYNNSRDTGGLWAALRPPCVFDNTPNPAPNVMLELDNACAGLASDGDLLTALPLSLKDPSASPPFTLLSSGGETTTALDANGRLLCDPLGQTKDQQIQIGMQRIMGRNPFLLVQ